MSFSVFWDSSGENFAIDKDTRKMVPSVKLAGTQFNYMPEDKYNSYGRVQAAGPTLRKVTVYVSTVSLGIFCFSLSMKEDFLAYAIT